MRFNSNRLMRLSGVISRDEYTTEVLSESKKNINEMEVVLSDEDLAALGVEDPEAADVGAVTATVVPEDAPEEDLEDDGLESAPTEDAEAMAVEESRLRDLIRKEVGLVIKEVMAQKEEEQIKSARRSKSVAVSMGFAGPGFGGQPSRKTDTARGIGGQRGFKGPGFR
tara:strand:- start:620 stop:1123 length:504 start_codon:yes stop_codon:yes gene_type:complete